MRKFIPLILVFLLAFLAAWPLLTSGFIPTHDGEYHLIRFFEFDKSIRAGVFFPRWASGLNSGLGVPLFNFFYPLPNYAGEAFHLLGFSFIESFKLTLAAGLILSGLFFYLWAAEILGVWAGIVGAVFYIFAPYHLLDVYVRGSPGEVWALVFFPAILWAVEKLMKTQNKIFLLLGSSFFAFLILSHNILAMIFLPFFISYMVFLIFISPRAKKLFVIRYSLFFILLGFGLASYFWLPALVEAKYVTDLKLINFTDHFPALFQLLWPSWGTGFSIPDVLDEMSFQIGVPHLLTAFICLILLTFVILNSIQNLYRSRIKCGMTGKLMLFRGLKTTYSAFFLTWFLIVFILLLEISLPFWQLVPLIVLLQYPWRLLSLMILVTSLLTAYLVSLKKSRWLAIFLILLALAFYTGYSRPVKYAPRTDNFYLNNPVWTDGTATLGNSFNTIWAKNRPKSVEKKIIFVQGECRVTNLFGSSVKYSLEVDCSSPTSAQLAIAYFPGWKVLIDGQKTLIGFADGLISFQIPVGKHIVQVEFRDTPIRTLANRISCLSLLFLAGTAIFGSRKAKKK